MARIPLLELARRLAERLPGRIPALLLALGLAAPAHALLPIAEKRLRSVVSLTTERSRGMGTILSSDGLVITSTKALGKPRTIIAKLMKGDTQRSISARVVARDDWFTLLQLDGGDFQGAPLGTTVSLSQGDRVITLDESTGAPDAVTADLGAVGALVDHPVHLQEPLLVGVKYGASTVGAPVFNFNGDLVGVQQSVQEGNFPGTRALRVEDVKDFLARVKAQVPPRKLTVTGPAGFSVTSERTGAGTLPLSVFFQPGDIITFTVLKDGKACGLLRPNTHVYDPLQQLTVGGSGAGTLKVGSEPVGATVLVDGFALGETPLELGCMGPGPYELLTSLKDHEGARSRVSVSAGGTSGAQVILRKLEGFLTLASNPPGGEVWVEGTFVGFTPLKKAPVTLGNRVVSVRFPGGARMRRVMAFRDKLETNGGVVDLPAPGALVDVDGEHLRGTWLDGHPVEMPAGWYVLKPGNRVLQTKDELGNVLTQQVDAPAGAVQRIYFHGGDSRLAPLARVTGGLGLGVGLAAVLVAVAVGVGVPVGLHLGAWALGGLLDVMHRQLWIPALVAGGMLAAPAVLVALIGFAATALLVPWERMFGDGEIVAPGMVDAPIPFRPTEGWEPRPALTPVVPLDTPPPAAPPVAAPPPEELAPPDTPPAAPSVAAPAPSPAPAPPPPTTTTTPRPTSSPESY